MFGIVKYVRMEQACNDWRTSRSVSLAFVAEPGLFFR